MTKNKIVHLIGGLEVGGTTTFLYDLLENCDKNLFEHHLIYTLPGPDDCVEKFKNLRIKTYQVKNNLFKYNPIYFIRLFLLIRKIRPKLIHSIFWSSNFFGVIIAKLLNIKIACGVHSVINRNTFTDSYSRSIIDNFVYFGATKIIAVSNAVDSKIQKNYKFASRKVLTIKNGINYKKILESHKNSEIRENWGISSDNFIIGSVGRFIDWKRHDLILDSFALLYKEYKDITLFLVGYGALEEFLKNKAIELKIADRVIFAKSDKAFRFYPLFDCFVLASTGEAFGLVTLEAMCFAIPCIVTCPDKKHHDIIDDNINGYLIEENNILDLYNKFKYIYTNRNESKKVALIGQQSVNDKFDVINMVRKYEDLFKNL